MIVAMGHLPVSTVGYGLRRQCPVVVVRHKIEVRLYELNMVN
jgi:hypothetical protein